MKISIAIFGLSILLIFQHQIRADNISDWQPEDPYNSVVGEWDLPYLSDTTCGTVQFRVIYLIQAHREAKELMSNSSLDEQTRKQLYRIVDDLEEVLITCYADTIKCFKSERKNPIVLLMIIYHYRTYVNSANEGWSRIIAAIESVDPEVTRRANELSQSQVRSE